MKRTSILPLLNTIGVLAIFLSSSFTPAASVSSRDLTHAKAHSDAAPVTIHATLTGVEEDGTTYTGVVDVSGGINASGTFTMPTKELGMALHCLLEVDLPDGDITFRLNCNMKTLNGQWKVLNGTGPYEELEGGGSLVMINNLTEEVMTGTIRW